MTYKIPYGKPDRNNNIITKEALINALKEQDIEPISVTDDYIEIEIGERGE